MDAAQYDKPPITEAIVELRSNSKIVEKSLSKVVKALSKEYHQHKTIEARSFDVNINAGGSASTNTRVSNQERFSSNDMTQQLLIRDTSIVVSQLAPYVGWVSFKKRIESGWAAWDRAVGFFPVGQIGMRFINRIDIPGEAGGFPHGQYVSAYPNFPPDIGRALGHAINAQFYLDDIEANLILNIARTESPLPEHAAMLLDIDITRVFSSPPSKSVIFEILDQFRLKKNGIFESCITEQARALFRRNNNGL